MALRGPGTETQRLPPVHPPEHAPGCEERPTCHSCSRKVAPFALTASTTGRQPSICSCV